MSTHDNSASRYVANCCFKSSRKLAIKMFIVYMGADNETPIRMLSDAETQTQIFLRDKLKNLVLISAHS